MEAALIVTYRCNARCYMCNTWQHPSAKDEEFRAADIEGLPSMDFTNITGGEPFLRDDLEEIISAVRRKSKRIVISTNGYFTDRILALAEKNPDVGIRISIEGLPAANDALRGLKDGFDHGLRTLLELRQMGLKDIGFGITVSDRNARDLMELYELACSMNLEFATAVVHNGYYFHKTDNRIEEKELVAGEFAKLVRAFLGTLRPKNWFRAYFNHGLINYVCDRPRLLPCAMGTDCFFLDPYGEIMPCNVMEESMGNIKQQSFDEIWTGERAQAVRDRVAVCTRNCWMIGSASPAMKRHIREPIKWILKNRWSRASYGRRQSECE